MIWFEFVISALIIVVAGTRLTVHADELSDRFQLGKVWIGVVLLGLVTSLPEAVTSLYAIIYLKANDLAIGNLLGSNNFNPVLIVLLDVVYRQGVLTETIRPDRSHKLTSALAVILIAVAAVDILWGTPVIAVPPVSVSTGTLVIALGYVLGIRQLARSGAGPMVIAPLEQRKDRGHSTARIAAELALSAAAVVAGGIWLARSAEVIAPMTGLGSTFFGSIVLAIVTSLPEMVVTVSALKLGSLDLAVGNIFGSNMTNMFIVSIADLVYVKGPVLASVSRAHAVTAVLSILLTSVAAAGIFIKGKKKILGLGPDSWLMIVLFGAGTFILYQLRLV